MAVTLIIMLGALFGAVGYFIANPPCANVTIVDTPIINKPVEKKVTITTDKIEYEQGEMVKITVRNNLNEIICFESCNAYYFQKKNWIWEEYLRKECEVSFITECIDSSEVKEFEVELSEIDFEKGVYKIAVPIYIDCQNKEWPCEEIKTIYSNKFTIKEKSALISDDVCKEICGDGVCNEIACMAVGCPCPESRETCPEDCK